jgi:hypothetical protein
MLNVIMLNVIMLNVVMLSVVAPVNALKRENVSTLTLSLKFGGKNCQNFTKTNSLKKVS